MTFDVCHFSGTVEMEINYELPDHFLARLQDQLHTIDTFQKCIIDKIPGFMEKLGKHTNIYDPINYELFMNAQYDIPIILGYLKCQAHTMPLMEFPKTQDIKKVYFVFNLMPLKTTMKSF
jgi:hypothetical protein